TDIWHFSTDRIRFLQAGSGPRPWRMSSQAKPSQASSISKSNTGGSKSVPQSLNIANPDDGSQLVWEDGERVFRRGCRVGEEGKRRAVLLVVPAADQPSRSDLDRLTHEYELRNELGREWAVRPLDLVRDTGRLTLVLEDEGGEPVDRLLGAPMEMGRFLRLA